MKVVKENKQTKFVEWSTNYFEITCRQLLTKAIIPPTFLTEIVFWGFSVQS